MCTLCVCVCVCVCVCGLTGHDSESDGGLGENGPGRCVLGVADVVVSAVALQQVGEVQVPVQADHHSLILLDVNHL